MWVFKALLVRAEIRHLGYCINISLFHSVVVKVDTNTSPGPPWPSRLIFEEQQNLAKSMTFKIAFMEQQKFATFQYLTFFSLEVCSGSYHASVGQIHFRTFSFGARLLKWLFLDRNRDRTHSPLLNTRLFKAVGSEISKGTLYGLRIPRAVFRNHGSVLSLIQQSSVRSRLSF